MTFSVTAPSSGDAEPVRRVAAPAAPRSVTARHLLVEDETAAPVSPMSSGAV